jgi:peptidyl-prolyl cis-trans isomerase D
MMKFLRSQSQTVLVVVLGVIGLGFLFYGNSGNFLSTGTTRTGSDFGRIDGDDLTVAELTDAVRNARYDLVVTGRVRDLNAPGVAAQVAEYAWRQLLLLHEADRLHVTIGEKELVTYIQSQPIFQDPKTGVFSPELYETRMGQLRDHFHIPADAGADPSATAKATFETVFRNQLAVETVSKALFNSVRSSAHDVSSQYDKFYGPVTVSYITFDPKTYVAAAKVTPEEIAAEYKEHPTNPAYRTQEQRKVDYVLFLLTPDQQKLPEDQKSAAKQALGQKALDFALAFQPEPTATGETPPAPDFLTEATKRGLNPATSDFFAADTTPAGVPPSPAFNNASFSLTKENAISKVIDMDNGVAVIHLAEIKPSDLRPLSEVQATITTQLQQSKGAVGEQLAAGFAAANLRAQVAKGVDFKAAATAQNFKVDTFPAFVPATAPPEDQKMQAIAYAAAGLAPGQVSDAVPIPSDNTMVVLHLDSRAPADPAGLADFETRFRDSQDAQLRNMLYADWANWKSNQPGTHKPPELDSYGTVE